VCGACLMWGRVGQIFGCWTRWLRSGEHPPCEIRTTHMYGGSYGEGRKSYPQGIFTVLPHTKCIDFHSGSPRAPSCAYRHPLQAEACVSVWYGVSEREGVCDSNPAIGNDADFEKLTVRHALCKGIYKVQYSIEYSISLYCSCDGGGDTPHGESSVYTGCHPHRYRLFTPELQWQPRGKRRISQGLSWRESPDAGGAAD